MSLVYDALKQQAGPAQAAPVPVPPPASWWARQSSRRRGGLLLAAGAVVAAPLALLAASVLEGAPADAVNAVAHVPTAEAAGRAKDIVAVDAGALGAAQPADASVDPTSRAQDVAKESAHGNAAAASPTAAAPAVAVVASAPPAPAPVATPSAPPADAAPASPPTPGALAAATPAPVAATEPAAASPINITVARRAADPARPAGDEAAVAQAVRAVESAVAAGDTASARDALATLESLLHADSLTLLRMQAWVAHGSQDMDAAEALYRRIAQRMPDDLNAGVNIALLDARRGEIASARGRLQRLAGRHGRSRMLAQAISELDGYAQ